MATRVESRPRPVVVEESVATKGVRLLSKTPVYLIIAFVGVLWLIPTIGLFFTLFLLFIRWIPMIAIAEVKMVLPQADPHAEDHHDDEHHAPAVMKTKEA